jgi:Cu2+-exporting ATPase
MTCAACAVSLESYLGHLDGVISVVVSYPNQSIFIEFNEEELQEGRLGEAAKEIGYELVTNEADSGNEAAALRAATHPRTAGSDAHSHAPHHV